MYKSCMECGAVDYLRKCGDEMWLCEKCLFWYDFSYEEDEEYDEEE